ncbi:MAG: hypothetical protein J7K26_01025 [Candidatus Aenigmarchaeota archaeon]|nr:hypothetical protein [Candidatus Aenigmarchaeota archaeon]
MIRHKIRMLNKGKLYGFTKHMFFYLVFVFITSAFLFNRMIFVQLAMISWIIVMVMHFMVSKYERRDTRRMLFGV